MARAGLLGACLLVATVSATSRRPPDELVYGGDASFPPYEYLDAEGRPAGLNVELIRAVARHAGRTVRVRLMPWPEVRAALASGAIDVASMYRSAQRAQEVDFGIPHELTYHEMFIPRGAPPLRSLADLAGRRVIVEGGALSAEALRSLAGVRLVEVASEPEALRGLARGEGDAAVVSQAVGRPYRERAAIASALEVSGPPVLFAEYGFATRKGRWELIELLNEGVATLKASGEYDRLHAAAIRPDRSARAERAAALALGVALLAVLLFVFWNRSLRRQVARQTHVLRAELAEKERAQAALADAERAVGQLRKMEAVGRLAGGVAHDFNNFLTVISSFAGLLRDDLRAKGADTADADEILAASERAARLTRQLLDFSRATPLRTMPLDLVQLVNRLMPMLRRLLGEQVKLELSLPAGPIVVEADPSQIEQILLNLTANARDAMPRGGRLGLSVERRHLSGKNPFSLAPGAYATVVVTDEGVGMDDETLARIFEPFFTTKVSGKGTGLGLATVLAHATKLGGAVDVESAPGKGTTFTLVLPLGPAPQPAPSEPERPAARATPSGVASILLVEDDEALRRGARRALVSAGYRVAEASEADEGLAAAARDGPFQVVVTDVVMPGRSGPQMVAELRAKGEGVAVLYVSGWVRDGEELDLGTPATAFLAKPYSSQALLSAVQALMDERRALGLASGA